MSIGANTAFQILRMELQEIDPDQLVSRHAERLLARAREQLPCDVVEREDAIFFVEPDHPDVESLETILDALLIHHFTVRR